MQYSDEYSLASLVKVLWLQKWLILLITSVIGGFGLIYALVATPYYKTEALLLSASEAQIEKINALELVKVDREKFSSKVYSALTSRDQLLKYFVENRQLFSYYFEDGLNDAEAFDEFLKDGISVSLPDEKKDHGKGLFVEISAILPESVEGVKFLNGFIKMALIAEQRSFQHELKDLIAVKIEHKRNEINSILLELEAIRENKIKILEEAKQVAEALKLVEPVSIASLASSSGRNQSSFISTVGPRDNALYLYGTRFLGSEIAALKTRDDEAIADDRVPKLRAEISKLEQVNVDNLAASQESDGLFIARVKSSPYTNIKKEKPKRALITLAATAIGAMFALGFIVVRRTLSRLQLDSV